MIKLIKNCTVLVKINAKNDDYKGRQTDTRSMNKFIIKMYRKVKKQRKL